MIIWRQVLHLKTFYGASLSEQDLNQERYVGIFKKTFLQIRIKKEDRDALRFHLVQIEVLQFARLVFGLVQSPFILGGTTDEHLNSYTKKSPVEVVEIGDDLFVEDLIADGENFDQVASLKDIVI